MNVLTVCSTYGRLPFLGRVVASFLDQTYGNKELLFINDDANVSLTCGIDGVHIINLNKRISIGAKRNLGVAFGNYDLYMPFDDDDIFLPNRIQNHVNIHKNNPNIDLYRNIPSYVIYGDKFIKAHNSPNAISYTKRGWLNCGGYPDAFNGEDQFFYDNVSNKLVVENDATIDYVYNWGGINYHASSGTPEHEISKIATQQAEELGVFNKSYDIVPDWCEYLKFVELERIYNSLKTELLVKHIALGKIDISHLQHNV